MFDRMMDTLAFVAVLVISAVFLNPDQPQLMLCVMAVRDATLGFAAPPLAWLYDRLATV